MSFLKTFKIFLENYSFCRKSGNDSQSKGRGSCFVHHYDAMRAKIYMWFTPKTPKNFIDSSISITLSLTTFGAKVEDHLFHLTRELFVLSAFNENLFALNHSEILFSSSLTMENNVLKSVYLRHRFVLSANIIGSSSEELRRPLT